VFFLSPSLQMVDIASNDTTTCNHEVRHPVVFYEITNVQCVCVCVYWSNTTIFIKNVK